ncbi:hypothetical protein D9758_009137 [Tetrapyrgos nigripes]|uniref:Uncharacterized protein n=1 Tax=Tetrapyrgos nigripes TaxID=182062 RepID=A0A8H5FL73_9AGAR|nr:hypothetical protein D9758_016648 [Tetrapyrgos nigripes]KAF5360279.1 hypothetical protein D9758_009137 [Tetrapyrgos nigripes]
MLNTSNNVKFVAFLALDVLASTGGTNAQLGGTSSGGGSFTTSVANVGYSSSFADVGGVGGGTTSSRAGHATGGGTFTSSSTVNVGFPSSVVEVSGPVYSSSEASIGGGFSTRTTGAGPSGPIEGTSSSVQGGGTSSTVAGPSGPIGGTSSSVQNGGSGTSTSTVPISGVISGTGSGFLQANADTSGAVSVYGVGPGSGMVLAMVTVIVASFVAESFGL